MISLFLKFKSFDVFLRSEKRNKIISTVSPNIQLRQQPEQKYCIAYLRGSTDLGRR